MAEVRTVIHPVVKKVKRIPTDEELRKANIPWTAKDSKVKKSKKGSK